MNGKCRGDLLGRPTFYGKSGVYLALLTMQYLFHLFHSIANFTVKQPSSLSDHSPMT